MIGKLIILIFIIAFVIGYFGVKIVFNVDVDIEREEEEEELVEEQNKPTNNTTNMSFYIGDEKKWNI